MGSKNHSSKTNRGAFRRGPSRPRGKVRPSAASAYCADLEIPSDPVEVHRLQQQVVEQLQNRQFGEHDIFGIKLAIEEAVVNAIKHGNRLDPTKCVRVILRIDRRRFYARICDEGRGFDPTEVLDPTNEENIARPCGRGLLLMRHYMSQVRFLDDGHTVVMWKLRNGK